MNNRKSGILMHITSLPSEYGIGTLGTEARKFIDYLHSTHQTLWQVLPLTPTSFGDSPYQGSSAFAGNPLLIDIEKLIDEELLTANEAEILKEKNNGAVDFGKLIPLKEKILKIAFKRFDINNRKFESFCNRESYWLEDYALFMTLKKSFDNKSWNYWPEIYKNKNEAIYSLLDETAHYEIQFIKFQQFIFDLQWKKIRQYANEKNISIIGDIPLYVSYDSVDCWANPQEFRLNEKKEMTHVAGVPPDYFSSIGQLWGNPLYNWDYMETDNFTWWKSRIRKTLDLYDIIRLDHFRGFYNYWAVETTQKTAVIGVWENAKGDNLLSQLKENFETLPIIAEDLGTLTVDVTILRKKYNIPGMKIIQFAFVNEVDNEHLTHNYEINTICYTGTHDNDTVKGWYEKTTPEQKKQISDYCKNTNNDVQNIIEYAWSSVAIFAITTMQDILGFDSSARMNTPGNAQGNWSWRLIDYPTNEQTKFLSNITIKYNRAIS